MHSVVQHNTHIRNVIYPSLDVLSSNSYLVYPFEWSFSLWYRQARKDFITAKYTEKRFARRKCPDGVSKLHTLCDAVKSRDIFSLIQVYAEGVDLMEPIPLANGHEHGETALHLAVRLVDRTSLHIVDFLTQNSVNLDKQTAKGSTALHYCCLTDNMECLKLLLRGKASIDIASESGETPLDIAKRLKHLQCEELVSAV
ncbi:unnamed protein product [Oncorhynchus mykiss]|uniref:Uncharacterized protein n=1 Tax=Oncorhynchus mykiss TaxID=8022 RepID=A0A060YXV1_ONCMY|nr:unnamed protein product [Oncorhynchus mykiss]